MQPDIDWKECVKDSPSFRTALEDADQEIDTLEENLEKLMKHCDVMYETGKAFNSANNSFVSGLREMAVHFNDDNIILEAIHKFTQTLSQWQNYHSTMLEQCNKCFCQNINTFIKHDIRKVKESRRHFNKMSNEVESAVIQNAQASRNHLDDCEGASNQLHIARTNFKKSSLEHVFEINLLQTKKRIDILNALLSYLLTHNTFIQQSCKLFADLNPYSSHMAAELKTLQSNSANDRQKLTEELNSILSVALLQPDATNFPCKSESKMEGYLFKRTSNAFKSWVRRWFTVENGQLIYCSQQRSKEGATVMEKDLRLCNVVLAYDTERRFCFQVISPMRTHMLQADSEAECLAWVTAIQDGASKAYSRTLSPVSGSRERSCSPRPDLVRQSQPSPRNSNRQPPLQTSASSYIQTILSIPGNTNCCDCGQRDPRWASINLGITLCIDCAGIHRSFGVHKSKVRSVTLDAWEPEHVKVMQRLGNDVVNRIFEAAVDETVVERATPNCDRSIREAWVTAKYIQKMFIKPSKSRHRKNQLSVPGTSPYLKKQRSRGTSIKQVASQDSGLGGSSDVIQFESNNSDQSLSVKSLCTDDSSSATCDLLESDEDVLSTSSFDELARLGPDGMLNKAALAGSLPGMLRALAFGASPNYTSETDKGKTPLIKAIESGQMMPVEFLLLNGAKVDMCDKYQQSPLHHAASLGHTGHICQLLKRNANQHVVNSEGKDPLNIAIDNADANVVTILRLARLNQEMKETDSMYDLHGDEMFTEVFKDFSNLVNTKQDKTFQSTKPPD